MTCMHSEIEKAFFTETRESRQISRCSVSHMHVLIHNTNQTPLHSHAYTLLSHSAVVHAMQWWQRSQCCKSDYLWGLAQEVWRSFGVRETISSLKHSGGGDGEEDALSREEFLECCPLICTQPNTLSLLPFFSRLALSDLFWLFCYHAEGKRGVRQTI